LARGTTAAGCGPCEVVYSMSSWAAHRLNVNEERPVTQREAALIRWLLHHGKPSAAEHVAEVDGLRVVSRCSCGCASVDFVRDPGAGLEVPMDYQWENGHGNLFGVFVFAKRGRLAGLEVWSIDGRATPDSLPDIAVLRPIA
jgi:hypothetical protein